MVDDNGTTSVPASPKAGQLKVLAIIVLMTDVLLLGANALHHVGNNSLSTNPVLNFFHWKGWYGAADWSAIEVVGYVQLLITAGILMYVSNRSKQRIYAAWSWFFTSAALDDLFMLHERTGVLVAGLLTPSSVGGLRVEDIGELLFWGAVAVPLALWILIAHRAADLPGRRNSALLFGGAALLAIFAVGLDIASVMLDRSLSDIVAALLSLAETAGELLSMSVILLVATTIMARQGKSKGLRSKPGGITRSVT